MVERAISLLYTRRSRSTLTFNHLQGDTSMNITIKPLLKGLLQFVCVFVIAIVGMMGTTSCKKRPCEVQNITWNFNFSLQRVCANCPNPSYSKLIVQRNNASHYNGQFPLPPGSSINFMANRNGGEVVSGTYVRICDNVVMICTGSTVTPNITTNCEIGTFTMNVPLNCVC